MIAVYNVDSDRLITEEQKVLLYKVTVTWLFSVRKIYFKQSHSEADYKYLRELI